MAKDEVLHNNRRIPMGTRIMARSMEGTHSCQERSKGKRIGISYHNG
jgi:hypothetical protein